MTALANIFFFFALLPFMSPVPVRSDVQLPAFIVAVLLIAIDVVRGKFTMGAVLGIFFAIAVWSFCFVLPDGIFTLRERVGMLLAFVVYYVVRKHASRFSHKTLYVAILLNFAVTMFQWQFLDLYNAMAPYVIRTVKQFGYMGRGMSGLSAEPSFLSAMALAHGLLVFYYRKYGGMSPRLFWSGLGMSVVALLLSRSATGFVFLFVVIAIAVVYYAFRGMRPSLWVGLIAAIVIGLAIIIGPMADSRGGVIVVAAYENPKQVVSDGSAQERTRSLVVGVLSLYHHPLGAGGGAFPYVASEMNERYRLERVFEVARLETVGGVLNAGGLYLAEMGFLFVFFLAVVLMASFRLDVFSLTYSWLALMFILLTFSITFPLTWILLGITARHRPGTKPPPVKSKAATA
jgi:hypothetical protein